MVHWSHAAASRALFSLAPAARVIPVSNSAIAALDDRQSNHLSVAVVETCGRSGSAVPGMYRNKVDPHANSTGGDDGCATTALS